MKKTIKRFQVAKKKRNRKLKKDWESKLEVGTGDQLSNLGLSTGFMAFNSRYYQQDFGRERNSSGRFK